MITEARKVEFLDTCSKMQSLSSPQLPELIKSFDSKFNQQKDVSQVKLGKPAKMKLRDVREVLEIARLKVLVSEMREKAVKLEAQLLAAAKQRDKTDTKSNKVDEKAKDAKNLDNKDVQDVDKINKKDLIDRHGHNVGHMSLLDVKQGANMPDDMCRTSQADDNCVHAVGNMQDEMCHNRGSQSMKKISKDLLEKQDEELDKHIAELHVRIKNLQCDVDEMVLQLPEKSGLQKELAAAKEKVKGLQEEIKDDAGITKAQLLLLKQQFGELEEIRIATEHKDLEFRKASQLSSMLEAEVEELRKGNKELLKHKQELSKKLIKAINKAEKITPVTKDDVLASQAQVSELRSTYTELQKKVESLQMSRFNEVEEVVYLRWVNACLSHDLETYKASHRNSKDISEQSKESVPSSHGKDDQCDLISHTNSGQSFTTYSDVLEYLASQNDDEESTLSCESSAKSSPQTAIPCGHMNSRRSPPLGHLNSSHVSPLTNTHNHVNSGQASPLSITQGHVNSSHTSPLPIMHGHVSSSHTSPQMPHQGLSKTKSGPLLAAQQLSSSNSYLSQSPEPYNPHQYSLGKVVVERNPQRLAEIKLRLSFNDRSAKSVTASTSNSSRKSGISFNRSASDVSSNSEASTNRMRNTPQKQDIKRFTRSASALSSNLDISVSNRSVHAAPPRRHSASSGMSLLDEYLHSTDTRGLNRPTSRFSAVLPYDRQFSDSGSVPFPTINEGAYPPRRKEHTNMKAHLFESNLDASDRLVAAFQALAASTHKNAHRTFKELSRQNSCEDQTADKVDDQVTGKHQSLENTHVDSNDNGTSRESQQSQSSAKSTQVDFFCDLAKAIQASHYRSIEKVAAFVNWFDRQGDIEKQEFFNFPDCPKDKVEAMRRAVYEYEGLQALENDLNSYKDDLKSPTDLALKDMKNLLDKVENHVQGFKQARELAIEQFMELDIPTYWMLDSEMIAKIKRASLKLAQRYIKRVVDARLDHQTEKEKLSRDMLLQAASFLLQIHNFAGGFDEQTASAFKMLQNQGEIHDK